jgi:MEMO1 family protein
MKTVSLILVMLIFPLMNIFGQERDRQPVVSGSFYPAGSEGSGVNLQGISPILASHVTMCMSGRYLCRMPAMSFQGILRGSGFAAIPSGATYDNIFLIGVSHRYAFEGAAVFTSGNLVTPLGTCRSTVNWAKKLQSTNRWFISKDEAHGPEHSLEVQLPFIQYRFNCSPGGACAYRNEGT